jgi:hypothetical protein
VRQIYRSEAELKTARRTWAHDGATTTRVGNDGAGCQPVYGNDQSSYDAPNVTALAFAPHASHEKLQSTDFRMRSVRGISRVVNKS